MLGRVDRTAFIYRLADHVQDAAKRCVAHRNLNGFARIGDSGTAHQTFGCVHSYGAHSAFA
jgi:hypothetical protein